MDTRSLTPEERIKRLVEEQEAKKKALAKKKKELEELEKEHVAEKKAAEEELVEQMEELASEERQRFEEQEEARRRRGEDEESLESKVGGEEKPAPQVQRVRGYGEAIDEVMRGQPGFYDLTNYNVVNRLEALAGEAQNRPLTEQEREFVAIVEYHANSLAKDDFYRDHQGANYLKKELAQIDAINRSVKNEDEKHKKDFYSLNSR